MGKKKTNQYAVGIESVVVFALLGSATFDPRTFIFTPGCIFFLLLALATFLRPAETSSWMKTGRWFSADLVMGSLAQVMATHRLLPHAASCTAIDLSKSILVALFCLMQLFWANSLNSIWDLRLGADKAGEKEGVENHGDDLRLAQGKMKYREVLRHTREPHRDRVPTPLRRCG